MVARCVMWPWGEVARHVQRRMRETSHLERETESVRVANVTGEPGELGGGHCQRAESAPWRSAATEQRPSSGRAHGSSLARSPSLLVRTVLLTHHSRPSLLEYCPHLATVDLNRRAGNEAGPV